jgi:protein-tyrosine-phosphatase
LLPGQRQNLQPDIRGSGLSYAETMNEGPVNVLFLCTGNSARSIIAECVLNRLGKGRFHAFSAGSHPIGKVNPNVLRLLERRGYPVSELHSKSWKAFELPGAPQMDFVFTVCDNAANEVCPIWPGHPISAHWGLADPAEVQGSESDIQEAFESTFGSLRNRLEAFVELPLESLDPDQLQRQLDDIGSGI